uniref:BLOC-1-related complex subunit 7 n=1 Tax=Amblyomma maculatum TaxID=34609 RepID=G3MS77_AMBMU
MTSSVSCARGLFVESKERLCDRIQVNVNSVGSLARQLVKGSRSGETLMHTARNFALQEHALHNSDMNLCKMQSLVTNLQLQADAILKCALRFEARSGCLRTRSYKKKFNNGDDTCAICGNSSETINHIILECNGIHLEVDAGAITVPEALGFRDTVKNI